MEMIKIPHTDLEVSRLALGCMGLGGGWEADVKLTKDHERQAREFLDTAEEIGANFLRSCQYLWSWKGRRNFRPGAQGKTVSEG
jgi:predicted aldo/keto reductase-like oxidoreductase